jgi:CheY-like chemotaxis protein
VNHIVKAHGGTVRADSLGAGLGSTFTISLPAIVPQAAKGVERETLKRRSPSKKSSSARLFDGVRLLLIDDDTDTLQMLTMILAEHGALVNAAPSAVKALEALPQFNPDILVSDLSMPEVDGYALIGKVREWEARHTQKIPAVALSANVRPEDRAHALSAGFNAFVAKPVEPHELITAISKLLIPRKASQRVRLQASPAKLKNTSIKSKTKQKNVRAQALAEER